MSINMYKLTNLTKTTINNPILIYIPATKEQVYPLFTLNQELIFKRLLEDTI